MKLCQKMNEKKRRQIIKSHIVGRYRTWLNKLNNWTELFAAYMHKIWKMILLFLYLFASILSMSIGKVDIQYNINIWYILLPIPNNINGYEKLYARGKKKSKFMIFKKIDIYCLICYYMCLHIICVSFRREFVDCIHRKIFDTIWFFLLNVLASIYKS